MKRFISYALCMGIILITACHSTNKASYTPAFRVSTGTHTFIEQLKNSDPAKPTQELKRWFAVRATGGQFYVAGLAKVNSALDENKLAALGIKTNTRAGNIFTLQIPLKNFKRFLQLRGIDYFEVSQTMATDTK